MIGSHIIAIDPGTYKSAYSVISTADYYPVEQGKVDNQTLLEYLELEAEWDNLFIEKLQSYGGKVGKTVLDTAFWSGRFAQVWDLPSYRVPRKDVKLNLCGRTSKKDSDVIAALVDRFTPGQKNYGKGTKAEPGWFHDFAADVWQAYALAVTVVDLNNEGRLEEVVTVDD